jgi:ubiquinone/menaquinone biosynthesis C-methylase UbiE
MMNHDDHVRLLRGGVIAAASEPSPQMWADLGSGTGAFTLALAELLGPGGCIYSLDKDAAALHEQQSRMRSRFPNVQVEYVKANFMSPLNLPPLDGIVMANSLHFLRPQEKDALLQRVKGVLKPHGRFILVEYNVDRGNTWVPFPLSYTSWEVVAQRNGFVDTRLLDTVRSSFLGQIYSALTYVDYSVLQVTSRSPT